ncbi:MAG: hypothetical protein KDA93_20220 [Planctomycetaceae bacterium]|nr:hypothetical protein [Planctomycetaceae bacterium]
MSFSDSVAAPPLRFNHQSRARQEAAAHPRSPVTNHTLFGQPTSRDREGAEVFAP